MNTGNAAIWWRVSTDDQSEMSPDTQVQAALALAGQEGYQVAPEHIVGTDWASLEVWNSPPMSTPTGYLLNPHTGWLFELYAKSPASRYAVCSGKSRKAR